MKTEDDTFRVLTRESFELTRKYLMNDRWDRPLNSTTAEWLQADADILWKHGWEINEYIRECNHRHITF